MRLPADYHTHTSYSDGESSVEELVERAIDLGLPEIGITDHLAPSSLAAAEEYAIPASRLGAYVADVRAVAARHPEITVLLGVEAEYVPEHERELSELLAAHPFDYVLGAVHYIDGFSFDDEGAGEDPRWSRAGEIFRRNYELLAQAARSGLFDVFAHLDYVTLWGHPAGENVGAAEQAALAAIAASGAAIEINTGGVVEPQPTMYPSARLLQMARVLGAPLVLGSDAHDTGAVGAMFSEGVARARQAGYGSWLRLSDRRQVPFS